MDNLENIKDPKLKRKIQAMLDGKITSDSTSATYDLLDSAIEQIDRMEEIKNEVSEKVDTLNNIEEKINSTVENANTEIDKKISDAEIKAPTNETLLALIKPLIPQVENGKTPTIDELVALIKPLILEAINGFTPTNEQLTALILPLMPKVEDLMNEIPKMGEMCRDGLELLQGDERLDKSAIKGIEELENKIKILQNRPTGGGIIGRDLIQDIDISSQLDGVTKTFNIQSVWRIISVDLSSFPYGSCRKSIDYTWTPTSITFTSQIDASAQLASGQTCILTVVTS